MSTTKKTKIIDRILLTDIF